MYNSFTILLKKIGHYSILTGFLILGTFISVSAQQTAQTEIDTTTTYDYYSMSLEELLKLKASGVTMSSELEKLINSLIGVASQKAQSSRKSPSIVSLITEEDIKSSGARDLIDVLRMVPGFQFGMDTQGVTGLSIRGNWAHEGKVLLLLDGQEMNETMYSTLQFGNHFDVSQIKRIEIIRGPGSAIYGGYAEYAVISIITKSYDDLKGLQITGTYGTMEHAYARRNISISAGQKIGNWGLSLAVFAGQGQRSDQPFTSFYQGISRIDTVYNGQEIQRIDTSYVPQTYSMKNNSALNPTNVNLGITYKNWTVRGIYDDYQATIRDGYDVSLSRAYPNNFKSWLGEIKYKWEINSKLTITPRLSFKRQLPWQYSGNTEEYSSYNKQADRSRGSITITYDLSRRVNIIGGGEFFNDRGYNFSKKGDTLFYNGSRHVTFNNKALFAQTLLKFSIAHITIGMRYDHNDAFGSAFVPRLGITRKFDKLHLKVLYSNSFRAPGIENINFSIDNRINPEKSSVLEMEAGYQIGKNSFLTINLFDITTKDPIVYNFEEGDSYQNFPRSGSSGLEMEYKLKERWGFLTVSYAFYTTAWKKETISLYSVPGKNNVTLGNPAHQIGINSNIHLGSDWSASLSGTLLSNRYGYIAPETVGKFTPAALLNTFIRKQNLLTSGLEVGLGIYDILNQKFAFIQPYNGGHAPLPGPSREFLIRVSYTLKQTN
ncbi:TonB-dependent receptor plug domain-containing protein [Cytophagaceae bacterium DM2B3-1]|uniref:TonB-dependent receptor plug domain-containing protein n=1 Tax=Xanthocytophaga flava TaxID=3048013 RepID=A0ABT7CLV4_9BACT|nr:TonB-dependent receptor plug domain-containing protein [Xanthocytophaga flavus]